MKLDVDYIERSGKWGVFDGRGALDVSNTKQGATRAAKSLASPGDTIQVFTGTTDSTRRC